MASKQIWIKGNEIRQMSNTDLAKYEFNARFCKPDEPSDHELIKEIIINQKSDHELILQVAANQKSDHELILQLAANQKSDHELILKLAELQQKDHKVLMNLVKEVHDGFEKINARIDNLVIKNHLIE